MARTEAFLFEHGLIPTITISKGTVLDQTEHMALVLLVLKTFLTIDDVLLFAVITLVI